MSKKPSASRNEKVRKLTKTGKYTYYVTIPKAFIDELGWRERYRLVVRRDGDKIVIERGSGGP